MKRSVSVRLLATAMFLSGCIGADWNAGSTVVFADSSGSNASSVLNNLFGGSSSLSGNGNGNSASVGGSTGSNTPSTQKSTGKGNSKKKSKGSKTNTSKPNSPSPAKSPTGLFSGQVTEAPYTAVESTWEASHVADATGFQAVIHPNEFKGAHGAVALTSTEQSHGYNEPVVQWNPSLPYVEFTVNVPTTALYQMQFDTFSENTSLVPVQRGIEVNGQYQYFESRNITFNEDWRDASKTFPTDPVGDEMPATPELVRKWSTQPAMDSAYLTDNPLRFLLHRGTNVVRIVNVSGPMMLGRVTIEAPSTTESYAQYVSQHAQDPHMSDARLYTIEAEHPYMKTDPSVQALPSGNPGVTPQRGGLITMNTLGGSSWELGGQSVSWKLHVDKSGFYQIGLKYLQSLNINLPTFRSLQIDGHIPFREVGQIPFAYSLGWQNKVLQNESGQPYQFYLSKGDHVLSLTADPAPYEPVIHTVKTIMRQLDNLSLQIKMVTGNTQDQNRDWNLTSTMPTLVPQLKEYAGQLRAAYSSLARLAGNSPDQVQSLLVSAERLSTLASKPNTIAYRYGDLTDGGGSINDTLATLLDALPNQPLQLDKIYVYANTPIPSPNVGLLEDVRWGFMNFLHSFTRDYSQVGTTGPNTVTVWVNRPREYVEMLQQLADQYFTPKTGIKVSMMVMPDPSKLILANAAKQTPDVALGLDNALPFNMGIRGAAADLTQFPDFRQVESRFSKGAMLPFIVNHSVYGIPESQDFWVLFYRKDILQALHLSIPKTWRDVIGMLPQLQRYGMNFYDPIAGVGGYKPFYTVLPFIYDSGGELYRPGGVKTAIASDKDLAGFKLMANLFSIYGLPLQVPNFYSHFRSGDIPIGISNFNTYVQLTAAAPELKGLWGIAPMPGIEQPDGKVLRFAPGTGQADMIFSRSPNKDRAWAFLKWWTSTQTQTRFETLAQTIYGPSFAWNSSNMAAFAQLPWPKADIQTILQQWKWLEDTPHVPGDYMVERGISNAWNEVVFNGTNPRMALENAAIQADREIQQQMIDLGYITASGKVIKPIQVPTFSQNVPEGGSKQ